jgi:hypothetical protein
MSKDQPPAAALNYIELHDGRVGAIVLKPASGLEVQFDAVMAYQPLTAQSSRVWSRNAVLKVWGLSRLEVRGNFMEGDYLMEGVLRLSPGQEGEWLALLDQRTAIHSVQLSFAGGVKVLIDASEGRLTLGAEAEMVDVFDEADD